MTPIERILRDMDYLAKCEWTDEDQEEIFGKTADNLEALAGMVYRGEV